MSLLTDKQKEELQKLADEVLKEAELVVKDYKDNPSDISGSMVNIHENSPFLDVDDNDNPMFSGSRWTKVLKSFWYLYNVRFYNGYGFINQYYGEPRCRDLTKTVV